MLYVLTREGVTSCTPLLSLCVQALASLRQKIKKYIKEADFEASVEEFRKVQYSMWEAYGSPLWEAMV